MGLWVADDDLVFIGGQSLHPSGWAWCDSCVIESESEENKNF